MCKVCQKHVKEGLKDFDIPHVEKLTVCKGSCKFCNDTAEVKIYYSQPLGIKPEPETRKL